MNIIFLINEIVKYVFLLSASWEIRSNGTDTLSDKASPPEYDAAVALLGHVDLKNTDRGSTHDEAGLKIQKECQYLYRKAENP